MQEYREYTCGNIVAVVSAAGDVSINGASIGKKSNKWGYQFVCFGGKKHFLHVLLLEVFVGPRPGKDFDACHRDGNRENNNLSNLYWGTKLQNGRDRVRHGTSLPGELNCSAVLNRHQVRAIFHMVNMENSNRPRACAVAKIFGVSDQAILNIWNQKSWMSVTSGINIINHVKHFNQKK